MTGIWVWHFLCKCCIQVGDNVTFWGLLGKPVRSCRQPHKVAAISKTSHNLDLVAIEAKPITIDLARMTRTYDNAPVTLTFDCLQLKGGFYSERTGELVICPNRWTKLFFCGIFFFFFIINGLNLFKQIPEAALNAQIRH